MNWSGNQREFLVDEISWDYQLVGSGVRERDREMCKDDDRKMDGWTDRQTDSIPLSSGPPSKVQRR